MYRFVVTLCCCLAGTFGSLACINPSAQAQQAAVAVGTVAAERKPIERSGVLVGRVEAVQRVEVRARVTGYLEEVLFKEGDLIKEGAPLYRIEKGLFEAAVTAGSSRARAKQGSEDPDRNSAQEGAGTARPKLRNRSGTRPSISRRSTG